MRNFFSKKNKAIQGLPEDTKIEGLLKRNNDKLVDELLIESEMRYRRLFESAKDGILILDYETGNIIDANPFIIRIIDYPLKKILGKKLWEIGLFKNREQSELVFKDLKTSGYIRFEDMPIQRHNRKITEVEFVSNVYLVNNKEVIQCNIRDITERKQTERKQEVIAKILLILGSQDNWKQSINDILIEIQNFTRIGAIGIRLKENEDYPYYEVIGFPEYITKREKYLCSRNENGEIIYDDKGIPYMECMCGNVVSARTDATFPYFTKGGSFFTYNASGLLTATTEKERQSPAHNKCSIVGYESVALIPLYSGVEIIGLLQLNDKHPGRISLEMIEFLEKIGNTIGIAFNRIQNENKIKESEQNLKNRNKDYSVVNEELIESLNRIQKINDELIGAKIKAGESDELKAAFLSNMSHEIRTPMNAIMGFSEVLLQPGLSKEKLEGFVQIINASSLQLLTIISDIIDISKIEAGQLTIDSELVNINILLSELFVTYKKLVELKKLSFHYSFDNLNDPIQIKTDGNRIKQILCNLLNNAIKFTKEGNIELGYKIKKNFIEFYVKDTGIGILPENQEIIFQRFRQVETTNTREYGGNGLGLSISKALVEKLGGTITVNSEFGTGSTFIFTIPYVKVIESIRPIKTTEPDLYNWNEKTVLIVEDEVNNHAYLEELLSGTNIMLRHAWNGREAVENVKNHLDISLVLMDIKMPLMDGYKATRLIKEIRPKLPVIAQTAYALSHEREEARKAGCDNYLAKPIDRYLFMEVLNRYLS